MSTKNKKSNKKQKQYRRGNEPIQKIKMDVKKKVDTEIKVIKKEIKERIVGKKAPFTFYTFLMIIVMVMLFPMVALSCAGSIYYYAIGSEVKDYIFGVIIFILLIGPFAHAVNEVFNK